MAEPTIIYEANEGTEGTPTWVAAGTLKYTGPTGVGDFMVAPILDATDAFYDDAASPNDGQLWNDDGTPIQVAEAGRALSANQLRVRETGAADATADPPVFTAYDDATDAGNRTAPTTWLLIGTTGTSGIGCIRGFESTGGAPGAGWGTQTHDGAPSVGSVLEGEVTNVTTAAVLAASGNKTFSIAHALPHDATPGTTTWVLALTYTYT